MAFSTAVPPLRTPGDDLGWRLTHLGRLLGHSLRRFDARVLELMAHDPQVPLALSNLAARAQIGQVIHGADVLRVVVLRSACHTHRMRARGLGRGAGASPLARSLPGRHDRDAPP